MRKPTKLYLWDIDGTLVYFRGAGRRAAIRAFERIFGIGDADARTRGVVLAGSTDARIMRELAVACGVETQQYERERGRVREIYLEHLAGEVARFQGDPVLPGVRGILASLAARDDARLGLLTGNYESGARMKLEPTGLNPFFATGGFGDDHEDRRIVASVAHARTSQFHGVEARPEHVYVVGDTVHDVDCAKANGFTAVAVCTGMNKREELVAAGADFVLDDLNVNDVLGAGGNPFAE
jgi:phosphoglycolate phosphatase-like HAD superfamily hydrolase